MKKLPCILFVILLLALQGGCASPAEAPVSAAEPTLCPTECPSDAEADLPPENDEDIAAATQPPMQTEDAEPLPVESPLPQPADSDFVLVSDYIPEIFVELKYSTRDNFTGNSIYNFSDAYLRYGTVIKLMAVIEELAAYDVYLKIWDAFRPPAAQFKLWEVCPDPNYVADPNVTYSSHSRGNTVDITLVDADGKELEMPTDFDDFSAFADRDYSDCSSAAAENALLLQKTMEKHGFSGYFKEWWHFSDETEYPPEYCFDPALISVWYADCNEFINLRTAPDYNSQSIAKIPVGEEFVLLGQTGEFALVDYKGLRGYVAAEYIQPAD